MVFVKDGPSWELPIYPSQVIGKYHLLFLLFFISLVHSNSQTSYPYQIYNSFSYFSIFTVTPSNILGSTSSSFFLDFFLFFYSFLLCDFPATKSKRNYSVKTYSSFCSKICIFSSMTKFSPECQIKPVWAKIWDGTKQGDHLH